MRGRQTEDKALVAVAAEADGKALGRIRLRHIPDTKRSTLHGFIAQAMSQVAPWSPMACTPTAT